MHCIHVALYIGHRFMAHAPGSELSGRVLRGAANSRLYKVQVPLVFRIRTYHKYIVRASTPGSMQSCNLVHGIGHANWPWRGSLRRHRFIIPELLGTGQKVWVHHRAWNDTDKGSVEEFETLIETGRCDLSRFGYEKLKNQHLATERIATHRTEVQQTRSAV